MFFKGDLCLAFLGVSYHLYICTVYESLLPNSDMKPYLGVFWVKYEADTHICTFSVHLGYVLDVGGNKQELRFLHSEVMSKQNSYVTMYDVFEYV